MDFEPVLLKEEPFGWEERIDLWPYLPVDEKAIYAILPDRRYVMLRITDAGNEWWSWTNKTYYDSYAKGLAS